MWYSLVIECKYTCYIVCLHNFRVQALTHEQVEEMSTMSKPLLQIFGNLTTFFFSISHSFRNFAPFKLVYDESICIHDVFVEPDINNFIDNLNDWD